MRSDVHAHDSQGKRNVVSFLCHDPSCEGRWHPPSMLVFSLRLKSAFSKRGAQATTSLRRLRFILSTGCRSMRPCVYEILTDPTSIMSRSFDSSNVAPEPAAAVRFPGAFSRSRIVPPVVAFNVAVAAIVAMYNPSEPRVKFNGRWRGRRRRRGGPSTL